VTTVRLGDGVEGLRSLAPGSVDLVLSDLPSGETRSEFDREADLTSLWPAVEVALKPGGAAVFMASSLRFAGKVRESRREWFRHDLVWHKSLASGYLNSARAPLRAHEFILVFSPGHLTYHPQMVQGSTPIHACRKRYQSENYGCLTRETVSRSGATDRFPTSVLEFASVGTTARGRSHPQQKPVPLMRWLVETYSEPGDVVADPYAGSGATGEAAGQCGRVALLWDDSPRFGKIQAMARGGVIL